MAELTYELSFKGAASETLAAAFEDCDVTTGRDVTIVRRSVPDQAALQGLVAANPPLSLIEIDVGSETVRSVAEVTLALVLFTDAAGVNLQRLRADASVPLRLLLIGLPLTIAVGVALSLALFADLDPWVCAVIAAAVPLMADRRIPRASGGC